MLSKVKEWEKELLYTWSSSQSTYNQTIEIATVTMPSVWKINIVGSCGATSSGKNVNLNLKVDGTALQAKAINIPNSTYAYDFNVEWDNFIPWGSEVKVLLGAPGTRSVTLNSGTKMYYEKYLITQTQIKAFTNTVKPIGSFITATIYWIDNNGVYRGGIINDTNTEAITGSIAPWNFVGYLEVNYNGSIVKVPYYN